MSGKDDPDKYDAKIDHSGRLYRPERTLKEIQETCPGMYKMAKKAAEDRPGKWDEKRILEDREKAVGKPMQSTFEAVREQQERAPFAENLDAIRGQPTPVREPVQEPVTPVSMFRTDDDRIHDDKTVSPLKERIEAIKDEVHHTRDDGPNRYTERIRLGKGSSSSESPGEGRKIEFRETLERVRAELDASQNKSSGQEKGRQQHHSRDGRDR